MFQAKTHTAKLINQNIMAHEGCFLILLPEAAPDPLPTGLNTPDLGETNFSWLRSSGSSVSTNCPGGKCPEGICPDAI